MSRPDLPLVVVRGGGDLGSGVVHRFVRSGFPVCILELPAPLLVRASVSFGTAVHEGETEVEGILARRCEIHIAVAASRSGVVPVVVDPGGELIRRATPEIVIDARMAKRPLDTSLEDARLVIGLGPGFEAGVTVHAVVETRRGHDLGRVLWDGSADADTGEPEPVLGISKDRVVRAPSDGVFVTDSRIGDRVDAGAEIGRVDGRSIGSPISGVLRGILKSGTRIPKSAKLADVDPRADPSLCFRISDKARAVGGGALEAALNYLAIRS